MIVVDHAGLAVLQGQLATAGERFAALVAPLRGGLDCALDAAGEFSGELAPGAVTFAVSWGSALATWGESCALLAGNVGVSSLQLQHLDAAATTAIERW